MVMASVTWCSGRELDPQDREGKRTFTCKKKLTYDTVGCQASYDHGPGAGAGRGDHGPTAGAGRGDHGPTAGAGRGGRRAGRVGPANGGCYWPGLARKRR